MQRKNGRSDRAKPVSGRKDWNESFNWYEIFDTREDSDVVTKDKTEIVANAKLHFEPPFSF